MNDNILSQIDLCFTNCKLLENNNFKEGEYEYMVNLTSKLCYKLLNNITIEDKYNKLIFVTLVEIAKRWKKTEEDVKNEEKSSFWCFVFKRLIGVDEYNQVLYIKLTNLILEMERQKQIAVVETGKRYYATLMMHAFSPKSSIFSFFDLCYNVYKKDLNYAYTNDDEWICEIVALQIVDLLQNGYSENKAVSIGSNAYYIKIGLRSFALHKDLSNDFIEFIKSIFEYINKLFNGEYIDKNTRLQQYVDDWWKNKKNEKISDKTIQKNVISTVVKQNIVAKYIKKDDNVWLCIPSIRLNSENEILRLIVYIGDTELYNEFLPTKRGEFVVSTKEKKFDLNELLKYSNSIKIQVKVTENGTVLYDSKETLNREFILFEDEKEIFSQINKPSNYFVFSKNIDGLEKLPQELSVCSKNFYNIYPSAGESLTGKVRQVIFDDNAQPAKDSNTICLLGNMPNVEWMLDDINCFVYKDSVKLIIPENINLRTLELKIDTKVYKLDTLDFERLENNAYMFGLLKLGLLDEQEPIELSLFSYEREKTILKQILIVLPDIDIKYNSPFFYGDIEKKITICNKDFSWSNQDNEIVYPLLDGNLIVRIPYLRWRIANKDWHNEPIGRKLWYKDFLENGDLLEIDNPKENEVIKLFIESDNEIKTEVRKNSSGKYEIGRIIYANDNKTDISVFTSIKNNRFELFTTATEEHFAENPIVYRNGNVYWDVENTFVGDKDNEFFIVIKSDKNNYRSKIANKNCEILNLKEDVCKIQVKIKNKNIFSKQNDYSLIFEEDYLIIGKKEQFRFYKKRIELSHAYFFNKMREEFAHKYYIDDLQYIEEGENIYYKGNLCIINSGKIEVINEMENENNERIKINPVRIEIKDSKTLWLVAGYEGGYDFLGGLFYDLNCREICNIAKEDDYYKEINLYKYTEVEYV